jgi:Flp pilus assembly protein TadD
MRQTILALLISTSLSIALPLPAMAEASDAAWHSAYEAVLKNPGDRALNQRYLDLCLERKDYEAAISPIERMLTASPDDVGLIFKLGQMYQNLRSDKVAQGYFKQVANHPKASIELRAQATALIQN